MDRETFKEQKVACDRDIETLERKISDIVTAETLAEDKADKMVVAKSFLDITTMTDEVWEQFVKDVIVYPGQRLELHWNFD